MFPQTQQQHRQFAGHRHHRPFLFAGARAGQVLAVGAQRARRAERPQDVMRGAHQQAAQQPVAAFADAQLLVGVPALVASRTQAQVRPHVAAAPEARRVADLQDEAEGGQWADAGDLLESLGDGVILFAARHQVAFQGFDLGGDQGQHRKQWLDDGQTIRRHLADDVLVKRLRRGVGHRIAQALEGEAHGVDQSDPGADERVAQLDAQQVVLRLGGAVLEGMQQGDICAGEAGEHGGIAPVALPLMAGDGVEFAGIGDDNGGPETGEETADPRAVRAGFEGDRCGGIVGEQLRERDAVIGEGTFVDQLAGGIQHAVLMAAVTQIEADGITAR